MQQESEQRYLTSWENAASEVLGMPGTQKFIDFVDKRMENGVEINWRNILNKVVLEPPTCLLKTTANIVLWTRPLR